MLMLWVSGSEADGGCSLFSCYVVAPGFCLSDASAGKQWVLGGRGGQGQELQAWMLVASGARWGL